MSTLQEQLLKAGLVDAKKAKQLDKQKRKAQKVQHKSNQVVTDETKAAAAQTRAEKAERDRQLNQQLQAAAQAKALSAQIRQLVANHRQAKGPKGAELLGYNFTDGKKIKKVYVAAAVQQQLAKGQLAIVRLDDDYELVPAVVANKISERDPAVVVALQQRGTQADDDDPYAGYEIPDDLMW